MVTIHKIYSENFKITDKLLKLVHNFSKPPAYKMKVKISTAFLQPQQNKNKKNFKGAILQH